VERRDRCGYYKSESYTGAEQEVNKRQRKKRSSQIDKAIRKGLGIPKYMDTSLYAPSSAHLRWLEEDYKRVQNEMLKGLKITVGEVEINLDNILTTLGQAVEVRRQANG
jgi:hypothetical protein